MENKGKAVMEDKGINGPKQAQMTQEWRPVGLTGGKSATSPSIPVASSSTSPVDPWPKSQSNLTQIRSVLGQNNTSIQIISVPELDLKQKENQNPNREESSIRRHYARKTKPPSSNQQGIQLRTSKKALQIHSPS
ncbi:unnamed protein product [Linum trigynum]|uniref:Uncharacterized protein n=1 Tax=Linum trigynum TaxID=586398 RepID=A0AAV2CE26_9ROSI